MKQLYCFGPQEPTEKSQTFDAHENYWKIFVDGASKNNPGLSGAGFYVLKNEKKFAQHGYFIGTKTNNQAEYLALILGLLFLKKHVQKKDLILIVSDSQLLVRQLEGKYKVKNANIKPLYAALQKLLADMNYSVMHVLRSDNEQADAMANHGFDKKVRVPQEFQDILKQYEITL